MFGAFLEKLTRPAPQPLPQDEARLALVALLVRAARSDGVYAPEERARIDRIAMARYGLEAAAAAALRAEAERLEAEAPDTVRFTRAIKQAVAHEDREGVMEAMWQVVLTDGARDSGENALMRMVAPLLGISDVDSARARQRVESRS